MSIPKPGNKVRGSYSGTPINTVFDLLGRRWALGIIWNLDKGPLTFRELQDKCGTISPSILNNRIKDLREADIVERSLNGYQLTARGCKLRDAIVPIGEWSVSWAKDIFSYQNKCGD